MLGRSRRENSPADSHPPLACSVFAGTVPGTKKNPDPRSAMMKYRAWQMPRSGATFIILLHFISFGALWLARNLPAGALEAPFPAKAFMPRALEAAGTLALARLDDDAAPPAPRAARRADSTGASPSARDHATRAGDPRGSRSGQCQGARDADASYRRWPGRAAVRARAAAAPHPARSGPASR